MAKWRKHVSDAVYEMLCAAFEVDPDSDEALARFVPAYEENSTTPQAPRTANVCYFAISLTQGTDYDYVETEYSRKKGVATATIIKSVPFTVLLTFYGPDADDDSEHFWSMIQWDSGQGSPRAILRKKRIVMSGRPGRPLAVHEVEGTYIRRRCDISMNMLYKSYEDHAASLVESPPDITPLIQYTT